MITKSSSSFVVKPTSFLRHFSSAAAMAESSDVRAKIDPLRNQVTDFLTHVNVYEEQTLDVEMPYAMETGRLQGFATAEGTDRYYRRSQYDEFKSLDVSHAHFKTPFKSDLKVSTLGYGTYMGEADDKNDYLVYDAIKQSVLSGGINNIDTAPNYRYMKSERTVGKILTTLHSKYGVKRDEIVVASKAGYVPEDGANMISQREMMQRMIENGIPEDQIVKESGHCLHPDFLRESVEASLKRLNLDCLDIMYLHNPYEAQGPFNLDSVFYERMEKAMELMEQLVEEGKIKQYGIATYSSLRLKPTEHKMHMSIQKMERLAQKVVGEDKQHNLRYVQVPCNMLMPEAFVEPWQPYEDKEGVTKNKILVGVLSDLEINLVTSQPLL